MAADWETTIEELEAELRQVRARLAELAPLQQRAVRLQQAITALRLVQTDDGVAVSVPGFEVSVTGSVKPSGSVAPAQEIGLPSLGPTSRLFPPSVSVTGPTSPTGPTLRLFDTGPDTFGQAAELILREAGEPLHVQEIISRMKSHGWYSSRSPEQVRTSLVPTLNRKAAKGETFTKDPDGPIYGLVGWKSER